MFSSVQSLSCVRPFASPRTAAHQTSLTITNSQSSLKLKYISSVMPSNHLILCHPLLLPPSIFPIRVYSSELALCVRWPKYWSFSFSISPSNEYSELISFTMGWLDLLAVQGILKSLLQYHSSKASILQRSAFFTVQLSHPYMTTGKTIALARGSFILRLDNRERTQPAHQQKIGLKIYWAWPCSSEQAPVSPSVSLSHQEASINLLSLSIRGQTEWKPQSQKTNQPT